MPTSEAQKRANAKYKANNKEKLREYNQRVYYSNLELSREKARIQKANWRVKQRLKKQLTTNELGVEMDIIDNINQSYISVN